MSPLFVLNNKTARKVFGFPASFAYLVTDAPEGKIMH